MENIVEFIFVFIMILIDNTDFFNTIIRKPYLKKKISNNTSSKHANETYSNFRKKASIIPNNKNIWVFNPVEISSRKWINYGSRHLRQKTNSLTKLCIDTIKHNVSNQYTIIIFNENDICYLLPKYIDLLNKCKNKYMFHYLIKYAILYTYGGLWLGNDVVLMSKLEIPEKYYNSIVIFSENNTNYYNNHGFDETLIMVNSNNLIIKKMLDHIENKLSKFQNEDKFMNSINNYFNMIINKTKSIVFLPLSLQKDASNRFITNRDLLRNFYNNIDNYKKKNFLKINTIELAENLNTSYILNMTEFDILNSNMFISTIFRYALNLKNNLVHAPELD